MFAEGKTYDPAHQIFLGRHYSNYLETGKATLFRHFFITEEDGVLL
jgi:hypothetical protein